MTEKRTTKTTRLPYCKPQVEKVKLVAEEAVLSMCKSESGINPGKKNFQCTYGVECFNIGS